MTFQLRISLLLGVILILITFEFESTKSIRLCGRRLADLLNFICEKRGGFHAPRAKRDVSSKSANNLGIIEVFKPIIRRSEPDTTQVGEPFSYQSGIVDECCKKQCTLAIVVSYCANDQQVSNIDLDELLSSSETLPEEDLIAYRLHQEPPAIGPESFDGVLKQRPSSISSTVAYPSRLNLGLSSRNRPVFIVLSQLQEDEIPALGEHRF